MEATNNIAAQAGLPVPIPDSSIQHYDDEKSNNSHIVDESANDHSADEKENADSDAESNTDNSVVPANIAKLTNSTQRSGRVMIRYDLNDKHYRIYLTRCPGVEYIPAASQSDPRNREEAMARAD